MKVDYCFLGNIYIVTVVEIVCLDEVIVSLDIYCYHDGNVVTLVKVLFP